MISVNPALIQREFSQPHVDKIVLDEGQKEQEQSVSPLINFVAKPKAPPVPIKPTGFRKWIVPLAALSAATFALYYFGRSTKPAVFDKAIPCGFPQERKGEFSPFKIVGDKFGIYNELFKKSDKTQDANKRLDQLDKIDAATDVAYSQCLKGTAPLHFSTSYDDYIYEGGLKNCAASGLGKVTKYDPKTHAVISIFEGNFKDGLAQGAGTYTKGSAKLFGNYTDGVLQGPGRFESPTNVIEGVFSNDAFVKGKMTLSEDGIKEQFDGIFQKPSKANGFDPFVTVDYHLSPTQICKDVLNLDAKYETDQCLRQNMDSATSFFTTLPSLISSMYKKTYRLFDLNAFYLN